MYQIGHAECKSQDCLLKKCKKEIDYSLTVIQTSKLHCVPCSNPHQQTHRWESTNLNFAAQSRNHTELNKLECAVRYHRGCLDANRLDFPCRTEKRFNGIWANPRTIEDGKLGSMLDGEHGALNPHLSLERRRVGTARSRSPFASLKQTEHWNGEIEAR